MSRPTWNLWWQVDVRKPCGTQTQIGIVPRLAVWKRKCEAERQIFPMIELSRLAVMWLWFYFHERVGSVYAYTRAAHMKRGACLPIRNITILMHFPRFGFNVTLVYQHESVRNHTFFSDVRQVWPTAGKERLRTLHKATTRNFLNWGRKPSPGEPDWRTSRKQSKDDTPDNEFGKRVARFQLCMLSLQVKPLFLFWK